MPAASPPPEICTGDYVQRPRDQQAGHAAAAGVGRTAGAKLSVCASTPGDVINRKHKVLPATGRAEPLFG
jgi:hypothetical protein